MQRGEIRDFDRYTQAKLLDHRGLAGVFVRPTITPMDIDFFVEADGQFLMGEFKRESFEETTAQTFALTRLGGCCCRGTIFGAIHNTPRGQYIDTAKTTVVFFWFYFEMWLRMVQLQGDQQMTLKEFCRRWTAGDSSEAKKAETVEHYIWRRYQIAASSTRRFR
jgi:hypothetical protein